MKYLVLLLLLTGCKGVKENAARKHFEKHPEKLAEICADKFPVKETFIEGETIVKTDTVVMPHDSVPCPPVNGEVVFVPCPPNKTVYVHTTKTDTIIKENTARLADYQFKIGELTAELESIKEAEIKASGKANNYFWILVAIAVVVAGGFVLKLKRLI